MEVRKLKIFINGKEEVLHDGCFLAELIDRKGFGADSVIVEYNYELVKSEDWPGIALKENDRLEILRFVGGG